MFVLVSGPSDVPRDSNLQGRFKLDVLTYAVS